MRKVFLPVTAALLSLGTTAMAAEFQPMGTLGIGGAGVARVTNAMAGYWNPAGLAFNEHDFSMPLGVSVGMRVSKGLADNVDKLSKFTQKGADGKSTFDNLKNIGSGQNPTALGDVVSLLSVLKDIDSKNGTLTAQGSAVVAVQVKHFAFGAFGSAEGFARSDIDLFNILPSSGGGTTATTADFAAAAAGSPASNSFFTDPTIRSNVTSALVNAGFSQSQANDIVNNVDARLSSSASGASVPAVTQQQAADILINSVAPAFSNSATTSIDKNQSAVVVKSLAYIEYPLSYGQPLNFGKYGKLGIGASVKVIQGRVYNNEIKLVENGANVDASTITDSLTHNYKDSYNVTFDLGALYKYGGWLNVGLVAKNLTSPSFDSPELRDQDGKLITRDANGRLVNNEKVTLKPQVRMGVALDPLSWLTIAADLDLTDNETVLTGLGYRSRNLGGGLELHPVTWFKLRGGMYKNLSNSDVGPVATAGLTIGTKWVNLDVDGAYALQTTKYDNDTLPTEARVETNLNIQF